MSESSTYQEIRAHLAYLRLGAAAEALPGELDHAREEKLGHSEFLAPPPRGRGDRDRDQTPGRARALRLPALSVDARRLRLQRPALGGQEADERARHAALPRRRHQRAA